MVIWDCYYSLEVWSWSSLGGLELSYGNVVNASTCQASRFVWSAIVPSYYVKMICAERSLASGHRSGIGMYSSSSSGDGSCVPW